MQFGKIRSAISALAVAAVAFCALLAMPAAAAPLIVATSVQGHCVGANGVVTVTLNNVTYNFFSPNLWFHFGSTVLPQPSGNPATFNLPAGTYNLVISDTQGSGGSSSPVYAVTVPVCVQKGSLTVRKSVVNNTGVPTGNIVFPVDVSCNHGAIHSVASLSNSGGYQQTVMNLPVGSVCHIQELAVAAPLGCHWNTSYPNGQNTVITHSAGFMMDVRNELVCQRCPQGTTEQTFPGTNAKFCCNNKLDPRSDRFCCTRQELHSSPTGNDKMSPMPGGQ